MFHTPSAGCNGENGQTTVMLKNIPNDYSRVMLLNLLNDSGFDAKYDFVYLPVDFRSGSAFGYAFINLISPEETENFRAHFEGFRNWVLPSKKIARVTWSRPSQGLAMNMERYRNSSVMHEDVPDQYKPIVFCNGVRVPFLPPTKVLCIPEEMRPSAAALSQIHGRMQCPEALPLAPVEKTTLMLRNIPNDYTRAMLTSLLDEEGFACQYNFLYLPIDFQTGAGIGYAFVNLISSAEAERFLQHFSGFSGWSIPSRKVAEVAWSNPNQGLSVHVERYRNSTVMHPSVPDEYKPVLLQDGFRVHFPLPTRAIRSPQLPQL
jgi:RNA recognition motif-containing protein